MGHSTVKPRQFEERTWVHFCSGKIKQKVTENNSREIRGGGPFIKYLASIPEYTPLNSQCHDKQGQTKKLLQMSTKKMWQLNILLYPG